MEPTTTAITTADYHTAGEPFRIVTGGVPALAGATVLERRRDALARLEPIRRLLVHEPRGHADMYGGFVVPPDDDGADLGVVFFHNDGYSTACGHGTIALVTWALEEGIVARSEGVVRVVVDVPSGRLETWATVVGGRVRSVRFRNVASFVWATGVVAGPHTVDIAFGGAFYAVLPGAVEPAALADIVALGRDVKRRLEAEHEIVHPLIGDLRGIYGVIVWQDERDAVPGAALVQRNVTVFADGEVDRSPCGSCTSARLALLDAAGRLPRGATLVNRSIIGTSFTGRVVGDAAVAGRHGVITEVEGSAHRTGTHRFTVDPDDDLAPFLLR